MIFGDKHTIDNDLLCSLIFTLAQSHMALVNNAENPILYVSNIYILYYFLIKLST